MKATVIDDEEGQIVLLPPGFELPPGFSLEDEEAEVHWEGHKLVLTPVGAGEEAAVRSVDV